MYLSTNKCLSYYNMWEWLGGVHRGTGMRVGAGPVLKFAAKNLKFGDEENFLAVYVRNPRGPGGIYKPVWLAMERKSLAKWSDDFESRINGESLDASPDWSGNGLVIASNFPGTSKAAFRAITPASWGYAFRPTKGLRVRASLYTGDWGDLGSAELSLGDTEGSQSGLLGPGRVSIRAERHVADEPNPIRLVPHGDWEESVTEVTGLALLDSSGSGIVYDVRITLKGQPGKYTGEAEYRAYNPATEERGEWRSMGSGPLHRDVNPSHVGIAAMNKARVDNVHVSPGE